MSAKEAVLDFIRRLPDDMTASDILEELVVRQRIADGLAQLDHGQGVPHAEAKAVLAQGAGVRSFADIFGPLSREFAASGMTEADLDARIDQARQEVWDEKHRGRP